MDHRCKILLIRCASYRLNNQMLKWIKRSVLFEGKKFDLISLFGGIKDLVDNDFKISEKYFQHIKTSIESHGIEEVIIFHHSDCYSYKKNYKFASPEEEKKQQIKDMKEAKRIITKKYHDVEVFLVWANMKDEKGKKIEFEVV